MKAGDELLGVVFNKDHRFVIPMFQRPYVWEEQANWVPLWSDIRSAVEQVENSVDDDDPREYFLGAFVTQHQNPVPRRTASSMVIDGQQRMTTLQVFLAAASRLAHARGAAGASDGLRNLTRNRVSSQSEHPEDELKVAPLPVDDRAFRWALRDASDTSVPRDATHRLVRASRWFEATLSDWIGEAADPVDRFEMLQFAVENKIKVVSVYLDARDDPQVIFEALNHAGVRLDAVDLVKNLLFQTLHVQGDGALETELLRNCWQLLETADWRKTVVTGRVKRLRADTLLAYWLSVQRGEESSVEHLFADFKHWLRRSGRPAAEVIRDIKRHAEAMDELLARPMTDPVARVIDRLDASGTTVAWPLLLFLFAEPDVPENEAAQGATAIDSFLMRRFICGLTPKDYNRLFASLLSTITAGDRSQAGHILMELLSSQSALTRYWPRDQEFVTALRRPEIYRLAKPRLRALLIGIENALLDERSEPTSPLSASDKLTIEHVLPQSWEDQWDLPHEASEEVRERREEAVSKLGNLTLVAGSLNGRLSNRSWEDKRSDLSRHSLLRITTASILTRPSGIGAGSDDEWRASWDETRIEARGRWLAALAVAAWPGSTSPESPPPTGSRSSHGRTRRPTGSIAQHIVEVFAGLDPAAELTIGEIASRHSTPYADTYPSTGAVQVALERDGVEGFELVRESRPLRARRVTDSS